MPATPTSPEVGAMTEGNEGNPLRSSLRQLFENADHTPTMPLSPREQLLRSPLHAGNSTKKARPQRAQRFSKVTQTNFFEFFPTEYVPGEEQQNSHKNIFVRNDPNLSMLLDDFEVMHGAGESVFESYNDSGGQSELNPGRLRRWWSNKNKKAVARPNKPTGSSTTSSQEVGKDDSIRTSGCSQENEGETEAENVSRTPQLSSNISFSSGLLRISEDGDSTQGCSNLISTEKVPSPGSLREDSMGMRHRTNSRSQSAKRSASLTLENRFSTGTARAPLGVDHAEWKTCGSILLESFSEDTIEEDDEADRKDRKVPSNESPQGEPAMDNFGGEEDVEKQRSSPTTLGNNVMSANRPEASSVPSSPGNENSLEGQSPLFVEAVEEEAISPRAWEARSAGNADAANLRLLGRPDNDAGTANPDDSNNSYSETDAQLICSGNDSSKIDPIYEMSPASSLRIMKRGIPSVLSENELDDDSAGDFKKAKSKASAIRHTLSKGTVSGDDGRSKRFSTFEGRTASEGQPDVARKSSSLSLAKVSSRSLVLSLSKIFTRSLSRSQLKKDRHEAGKPSGLAMEPQPAINL